MTIEKITHRARLFLGTISLLGVGVFSTGIYLLITTLRHQNANHVDWVPALSNALPALLIAALGLPLTLVPWAVRAILSILSRNALDQLWRYEQVMGTLESQRQILEAIRDTSSLSDAAKSIAYRQKDREALKQAINEDIEKGDFETANSLIEDMERRFGYKQEVDELREKIETGWRTARERYIIDVLDQVDNLLTKFDWDEAKRISDRMVKRFGDHPQIFTLPDRIQTAKDNHKRDLLKAWKDALTKDDLDASVELLKQLDQYLSPAEAEAYKEGARDVFRKRIQQVGVQFSLHVHDKNWQEAVKIGQQIMNEFPNTRIAAEVRDKMPILMEKANQPVGIQP